jgi:hypothetical protein
MALACTAKLLQPDVPTAADEAERGGLRRPRDDHRGEAPGILPPIAAPVTTRNLSE